jgi:hypothetical protein
LKVSNVNSSTRFDLAVIFSTARQVLTEPVAFYRSMDPAGGYANPVIFVLVMSAVAGLIGSLMAALGLGLPGAGIVGTLFSVLVVPLFVVIGSFILAAVLFVIWKLMGSGGNYQLAYRCVAFASAILPVVALAGIVPYLGNALRIVWGTGLMVVAAIEAHKISRAKAWVVLGVIGAFSLFSNLSAEHQARKLQQMAEGFKAEFQQSGSVSQGNWPGLDPSTPPAAANMQPANGAASSDPGAPPASALGKAANEFLRGLQEGSGDLMSPEEQEGLTRAGDAVGKLIESLEKSAEELQAKDIDQMSPKEAGATLGALLKSLQQAAVDIEADLVGNTASGKTAAPDLSTIDIAALESLGSIEKVSRDDVLQLAVNDDAQFAALTRPASVYRDTGGIRYQLWMTRADLDKFRAFGKKAEGWGGDNVAVQSIELHNAVVFVYDSSGMIRGGDQCRRSVLQIPNDPVSVTAKEQEFWLWCELSQRSQIH